MELVCNLQDNEMITFFQDLQLPDNPLNGRQLDSAASMAEIYQSLRTRKPFLFELRGENGFMLTIGFAGDTGSAQHSPCDGSPPYLMAISDEIVKEGDCVAFLAGNTPTPIPRRFCLPISTVEQIICEFIESGEKFKKVTWEEI
jgi:hypothetical protein